jgi:hypothetical protein
MKGGPLSFKSGIQSGALLKYLTNIIEIKCVSRDKYEFAFSFLIIFLIRVFAFLVVIIFLSTFSGCFCIAHRNRSFASSVFQKKIKWLNTSNDNNFDMI